MSAASRTQGKTQVAPDVIVARRLQRVWGIGRSRPTGSKLYTLEGAVREVGLELVLDKKTATHRLVLGDKINYATTVDTIRALGSARLLTATEKMSAPSWSLPAGPPVEGGSCSMANKRPGSPAVRRNADDKPYICDLCYSLGGNYLYASTQFGQLLRMIWLREELSRGTFAASMLEAIQTFATQSHLDKNAGTRLALELGVWSGSAIQAPIQIRGRRPTLVDLPTTELPKPLGSTRAWLKAQGVPRGAICGFFRVHDSGDLTISNRSADWLAYTEAWIQIAEALPWVQFWLPTRVRSRSMVNKLREGMRRAPNFVPRISALFVDDHPKSPLPTSTVFSSGSDPGSTWMCPVVPGNQSSCGAEGCRACWIKPKLQTGYREH